MQLDIKEVEELAKTLYIRALKLLPNDIKQGFERLLMEETDTTGKTILGTMVENIAVAKRTKNLLCQDTGIPIYNVVIGRHVEFDGAAMKQAIRRGCERATKEHPLRSSVVHPVTRTNEQTSCGIGGTSDLCMHLAKIAATRPLGTSCSDPEGAKIEAQLSEAVNQLGIGPQGLGGRATSFRVHVEVAATHITMNPVAVNIQCHSARRASAIITPGGIAFE